MENGDLTFRHFAFTFNKNYAKNSAMKQSDYDVIFNKLTFANQNVIRKYYFEYGAKQNRLHLHGIISIPTNTLPKTQHVSLSLKYYVKGFCSKFVEIYDHTGWDNYISKEATSHVLWNQDDKPIPTFPPIPGTM